ncbi:hypothetical protein BO83DRAFT_395660 [Aspergillus eucalypticola CBS 122712]|uniref:NAD(P)-binding protein n=1 Tax=Aspergillus eucalypticola (strain CBS 122712 / IBT 29274) TaxID=1448314 RepID=A0A317W9W9_ASPEC|nr:uncharacterized protein BO83DRAFT_395660 [Aspergillus eucalypticola CBS 122712]PWY82561.1 hypothetical protein BO83DRAFT_395660 [Aspergillus eucalypticola CBS 122712]
MSEDFRGGIIKNQDLKDQRSDKVILVTAETVKALFKTSTILYLTARDITKVKSLDLNSLTSIQQYNTEFISKSIKLNILIKNAGAIAHPKKTCYGRLSHTIVHSRVIILSSSAHIGDKTANIWTANEINCCFGSKELHAFSIHPGAIATDLLKYVPDNQKSSWDENKYLKHYWKNTAQGAATTGKGGKYPDDCQIAGLHDPARSGGQGPGYGSKL